jgi:galactokinase
LTIGTYAVARKRNDDKLRFYSLNFKGLGIIESSIHNLEIKKEDNWANYPKGVIWALQKKGYPIVGGMDVLYFGNIPNASGLSSSASLEVLTGFILKNLFQLEITNTELALISQYSENNFNGVNCGIMDQFAVAMGKKNNAIFLDTADLSYVYAPLELGDSKIVIMNTNKKRGLGDSKYNERRSECEAALRDLQKVLPVTALGELTEEQFEEYKEDIKDPVQRKRAKHAVYENQRTIKAVDALKKNDLTLFGQLMIASHDSLRDDYEVTGIELDTIVEAALKQEGVIGARMTGAGFGGCAVSIVKEAAVEAFIKNVGKEYNEKIGYLAAFYVVEVGDGPIVL